MKKEQDINSFDLNDDGVMDEQELLAQSWVTEKEEHEDSDRKKRRNK